MPTTKSPSDISSPSTVPGGLTDGVEGRDKDDPFRPAEPTSFADAQLNETEVEQLILKFLFGRGEVSGRGIAEQICLPFGLLESLYLRLKQEQLVAYKDATAMNDYVYVLTDLGRERARRFMADCSYCGSATVSLGDYIHSVREQSLGFQNPSREDLQAAFSDLLINEKMFGRLGSCDQFGPRNVPVRLPRQRKNEYRRTRHAVFREVHLHPARHWAARRDHPRLRPELPRSGTDKESEGLLKESRVDKRWVRVKRPTVVVGGELTMAQLELQYNASNGTNEAPIQLKSNCGTLVIDDFGRQKMSTDELLNRWIVPLEKRYDFLNLPSGKSVQIPFDQLVVFSTNLEPRDLVDDAFLRRIPYKIEVENPSEQEFVALFKVMCPIMGFEYDEAAVRYVIDTHYKPIERPFRCCNRATCCCKSRITASTAVEPMSLSPERFDFAVENYFAVM